MKDFFGKNVIDFYKWTLILGQTKKKKDGLEFWNRGKNVLNDCLRILKIII